MNNDQKRLFLFLGGCIVVRIIFVLIALKINEKYLPILGYLALVPAIAWMYLFLFDKRKTGAEVFGSDIWWNDLRPIHASLYILFAVYAIKKKSYAWVPLAIDVALGLTAFTIHKLKK